MGLRGLAGVWAPSVGKRAISHAAARALSRPEQQAPGWQQACVPGLHAS